MDATPVTAPLDHGHASTGRRAERRGRTRDRRDRAQVMVGRSRRTPGLTVVVEGCAVCRDDRAAVCAGAGDRGGRLRRTRPGPLFRPVRRLVGMSRQRRTDDADRQDRGAHPPGQTPSTSHDSSFCGTSCPMLAEHLRFGRDPTRRHARASGWTKVKGCGGRPTGVHDGYISRPAREWVPTRRSTLPMGARHREPPGAATENLHRRHARRRDPAQPPTQVLGRGQGVLR